MLDPGPYKLDGYHCLQQLRSGGVEVENPSQTLVEESHKHPVGKQPTSWSPLPGCCSTKGCGSTQHGGTHACTLGAATRTCGSDRTRYLYYRALQARYIGKVPQFLRHTISLFQVLVQSRMTMGVLDVLNQGWVRSNYLKETQKHIAFANRACAVVPSGFYNRGRHRVSGCFPLLAGSGRLLYETDYVILAGSAHLVVAHSMSSSLLSSRWHDRHWTNMVEKTSSGSPGMDGSSSCMRRPNVDGGRFFGRWYATETPMAPTQQGVSSRTQESYHPAQGKGRKEHKSYEFYASRALVEVDEGNIVASVQDYVAPIPTFLPLETKRRQLIQIWIILAKPLHLNAHGLVCGPGVINDTFICFDFASKASHPYSSVAGRYGSTDATISDQVRMYPKLGHSDKTFTSPGL
ncbi:hypothetical protein FPV67DRAFT_1445661 [Lyophyllum atratum]|nr:hypothetical protein FPV67DRAFT_1445661 [Lyophyllum atratum]